jgi:hypothetical protein
VVGLWAGWSFAPGFARNRSHLAINIRYSGIFFASEASLCVWPFGPCVELCSIYRLGMELCSNVWPLGPWLELCSLVGEKGGPRNWFLSALIWSPLTFIPCSAVAKAPCFASSTLRSLCSLRVHCMYLLVASLLFA